MIKHLFAVLLLVNGAPAWAQGTNFSTTVGMAVLCIDHVEPGFIYNTLRQAKPPARREQGAYWFKTSDPLFGAPVTEVFVSDGSRRHTFVGVISPLPPDQLAAALAAGAPAGGSFRKIDAADKQSPWVSAAGAQIVFQGKNAKLFCRRDRIRLLD